MKKVDARSLRAHCTSKVRHQTRHAARVALNATLADHEEQLGAYACKFCTGWHNGHLPADRYRAYDPLCACGHKAITHESFPGLGCFECDCLAHREGLYRKAIRFEQNSATTNYNDGAGSPECCESYVADSGCDRPKHNGRLRVTELFANGVVPCPYGVAAAPISETTRSA